MKKMIFILCCIFLTRSVFADISCLKYYGMGEITTVSNLNFEQRFNQYLAENEGYFPLLVDSFLEGELKEILAGYQHQILLLQRQGVDSPLQSSLKVFEVSSITIEEQIKRVEKLVTAGGISKFFNFGKSKEKKLEEAVEDFKSCKKKFDECSLSLDLALKEASKNIITNEQTIEKLGRFQSDLASLYKSFQENPEKYRPRTSTVRNVFPLLDQRLQKIQDMIINLESLLASENTLIIAVMMRFRIEVPTIKEKIAILMARNTPKELLDKPSEEATQIASDNITYNKIMSIVHSDLSNYVKIQAISNIIHELPDSKRIPLNLSLDILKRIPLDYDWQISSEYDSNFLRAVNSQGHGTWKDSTPVIILICYELIKKTSLSGDKEMNKHFINQVNHIVKGHLKDKHIKYEVGVSLVFAKLLEHFNY